MPGQIHFTLQDYQEAAVKYKKELLLLPLIGSEATLKHMTGRPGIRYKERVTNPSFSAQFAPYNPSARVNSNLELEFRDLNTYLGSVVADFEPNSAITTLLGEGAFSKGDAQAQAPTAKLVLALMAKSLSYNLNNAIWSGVRNASGTTTQDLFNGLDTITQAGITDGSISAAKGNYQKLTAAITAANADDVIKDILFNLDPNLRAQDALLFCSQDIYDKYNEAYLSSHAGIAYNARYDQHAVEGSDGRLTFVPLASKAGSSFIHVTPKSNVLYGYDTTSDETSIEVARFSPFVLSFIATMFFGVQFQSVDKRVFKAIELA